MSAQIDQNYHQQPAHANLSTSISSSGSTSPNSLHHQQTNYFANLSTTNPSSNKNVDIDIDFASQLKLNSAKTKFVSNDTNDIKTQVYYCGLIMVVYIKSTLKIDEFYNLLREICKFDEQQLFTIKWVDEEGDPCTVSSQIELDEALRLYYLNKESELVVHIFANIPERPGTQCAGEDRSIYRRGARRWRKIYLVNGHKYQAKRFARTALCGVCQDRIWGLGRQGYKCLECKIMVHKRCHKFIKLTCNEILAQQQQIHQQQLSSYLSSTSTSSAPSQIQSSTSSHSINSNQAGVFNQNTALIEDLKQAQKNKNFSQKHEIFTDLQNAANQQKTSSPIMGKNKSFNAKLSNLLNKQQNGADKNKVDNEINIDFSNKDSDGHKLGKSSEIDSGTSSKQISLEQFDLIKVIGRGSYAKVFLVEYKKTKKCYAMKVIKKSIVNDDEDIDWVQTEKHVFEQATNHPFLVGLHSCFQTESRLFFVIEYLCGGDLMYHMQRKRRLPEDHARFYSAEISVALGFLHSRGIIYRDLKLDNVLLDIEGHVKLTDYGMCKEGLGKGEKTSTFCGTPNYIAPEMLRGEDYDFSVDWWALGVLLYEMMAGRSPFEPVNENPGDNPDLNTEDHLFQVILEKPIRIPRSLSVRAASVLKGFLQKQPTERLASHDGLNEVKQHLFFRPIDWNLLEQRMIQPPYKPPVQNERDLNNIDELFTREPVMLTPDTPNTLARIQQNEFDGFEYINPLILSDEIPV